mmetsp:Transcript_27185/g.60165  ORF Transcript_27185/g.60165 Transcript_27185/m.60165 type:complete len:215 (-) Transcript_27185:699-1343(-)
MMLLRTVRVGVGLVVVRSCLGVVLFNTLNGGVDLLSACAASAGHGYGYQHQGLLRQQGSAVLVARELHVDDGVLAAGGVLLQPLEDEGGHEVEHDLFPELGRVGLELGRVGNRGARGELALLLLHFRLYLAADHFLQQVLQCDDVEVEAARLLVLDRVEGDELQHLREDVEVHVDRNIDLVAPEELAPRVEQLVMLPLNLLLHKLGRVSVHRLG